MEERRGGGRDGGGGKVRDSVTYQLWYCVGAIQFNSIKKNFNHPTRGNFVVVIAGS